MAEINSRVDEPTLSEFHQLLIADCAVVLFLLVDRGSLVADSFSLFVISLTYIKDSLLVVQYLSGPCFPQNKCFFLVTRLINQSDISQGLNDEFVAHRLSDEST